MKLVDYADIVRSKNAGPFLMCLDIIFSDEKRYLTLKRANIITTDLIARLCGVSQNEVMLTCYDAGYSIKATIPRTIAQGDIGDNDLYGCQQGFPLYEIDVPE
jgi:hypothetical protein